MLFGTLVAIASTFQRQRAYTDQPALEPGIAFGAPSKATAARRWTEVAVLPRATVAELAPTRLRIFQNR